MWLDVLKPEHYTTIRNLIAKHGRGERGAYPAPLLGVSSEQVEGFVVVSNEGKLVGCVTFTDYMPECNVLIHAFIHPDYRKRWLRRDFIKTIFDYAFETVGVCRITALSIEDITESDVSFIERAGFKKEGTMRRGAKISDSFYDVHIYGLLKEERRW